MFKDAAAGGGGVSWQGAHFLRITDFHWYWLIIFIEIDWKWLIFSYWDWRLPNNYQGPVVVVVCGGNLVSTSLVRTGQICKAELDYDPSSRWRLGGQRLFEGIVGRCQEELCHFQMSPFHCIVFLFVCFLNIVCYQLYQSDVTHLTSLPPWNK